MTAENLKKLVDLRKNVKNIAETAVEFNGDAVFTPDEAELILYMVNFLNFHYGDDWLKANLIN